MQTIIERIQDVWGGYVDFKRGGFPYVAYIISNDVQDMTDEEYDEEECVEELADTIINATRMLDEKGYDPEQVVLERLDNHQEKNPDRIIEKYQQRYQNDGGDAWNNS